MKAKIVMLKTTDKSRICHLTARGKEFNDLRLLETEAPIILDSINYHFYLIDPDAEIKEGDWYYYLDYIQGISLLKGGISNASISKCGSNFVNSRKPSKIIAATNKSLIIGNCEYCDKGYELDTKCMSHFFGDDAARCQNSKLPQLSEQSIKLLLDYYNKNGKLPDDVDVESGSMFPEETFCVNDDRTVDITIPEEKIFKQ